MRSSLDEPARPDAEIQQVKDLHWSRNFYAASAFPPVNFGQFMGQDGVMPPIGNRLVVRRFTAGRLPICPTSEV
jgi:hypothetical protein